MTFSWGTIVFIFIGYVIVYSIINRICQCLEACALSKAFAAYLAKNGTMNNFEKFATAFANTSKAARKVDEKGTSK